MCSGSGAAQEIAQEETMKDVAAAPQKKKKKNTIPHLTPPLFSVNTFEET